MWREVMREAATGKGKLEPNAKAVQILPTTAPGLQRRVHAKEEPVPGEESSTR